MASQYAHGDWKVDGVECPISSAGLTQAQYADDLGEEFDEIVRVVTDNGSEGVLSREEAKQAWEKLMSTLESHSEGSQGMAMWYGDLLELAEEVERIEFKDESENN